MRTPTVAALAFSSTDTSRASRAFSLATSTGGFGEGGRDLFLFGFLVVLRGGLRVLAEARDRENEEDRRERDNPKREARNEHETTSGTDRVDGGLVHGTSSPDRTQRFPRSRRRRRAPGSPAVEACVPPDCRARDRAAPAGAAPHCQAPVACRHSGSQTGKIAVVALGGQNKPGAKRPHCGALGIQRGGSGTS